MAASNVKPCKQLAASGDAAPPLQKKEELRQPGLPIHNFLDLSPNSWSSSATPSNDSGGQTRMGYGLARLGRQRSYGSRCAIRRLITTRLRIGAKTSLCDVD